MKKRTLPARSGLSSCRRWRMSSCFFSSREKMRISPMSLPKKCLSTVLPKLPVPPVIMRVLPLKALSLSILSSRQLPKRLLKALKKQFFTEKMLVIPTRVLSKRIGIC